MHQLELGGRKDGKQTGWARTERGSSVRVLVLAAHCAVSALAQPSLMLEDNVGSWARERRPFAQPVPVRPSSCLELPMAEAMPTFWGRVT